MDDQIKTKPQLIAELEAMRRQLKKQKAKVKDAEAQQKTFPQKSTSRPPRLKIQSNIQFIGDFDVLSAQGIDLSQGGISFVVADPLPFEMEFKYAGKDRRRRGHLMWVKQLPEGGFSFGLKFVYSTPTNIVV